MTTVMLALCILALQSFIRTSYSLSFELAEIIPNKPLLARPDPVRVNQFIEALN